MSASRARAATVVRARSGDAALLGRVAAGRFRGRVHSVFRRVVNVESTRGTLVAFATRDVDDAPDTIVLDLRCFAGCGVHARDEVRVVANAIVIGNAIVIDVGDAAPWRARLPDYPGDDSALRNNLAVLRMHLFQTGAMGPAHRSDET